MKIFISFINFMLFCAWADSCRTVYQACKVNTDCCSNHFCKDIKGDGNGHCVLSSYKILDSKKLIIECWTPLNRTFTCGNPFYNNSRATFRCNTPIYRQTKEPEYNSIIWRNGQWNRPILDDFCEIDCGRSTSKATQITKAGEQKSEIGEFPWHAGIYEFNRFTKEYDQTCGGTLISLKIVISAAHCFTIDGLDTKKVEIKSLSSFKVGVGKYYRNFNATEKFAQIRDVTKVEIPSEYKGISTHFEGDIAFVILKEEVEYSRAVSPICIDVGEEHFEENPLMEGSMGQFSGWDLNDERIYNSKLMVTNVPFISKDKCLKKLSYDWFYYINYQKICAGDERTRYNVCEGNGGAGLVFADPITNKYYLRGVVSLSPKCDWEDGIAVFTTLSSYKKMVKKYSSDDCEALSSNKLLIECFSPSNHTVSCNKSLETNSRATFRCKTPIYSKKKESEYTEITCMNGEWNRPLLDDFCEVECGKHAPNVTRPSRSLSNIAQLPWHAAIYELNFTTKEWEQICGGTLISSKVVISAAVCFDKHRRKSDPANVSTFKVAVGKFYRDITAHEDKLGQIKEVASIRISPDYDSKLLKREIAFVILKESVEYSRAVIPICIDIGEFSFESDQLVRGAIGQVGGWGYTNHGIPSERLMLTKMEFVSLEECKTDTWQPYLSDEKICAKGRKPEYNVCKPYTGGGLIFEEPIEDKYYLRGVLGSGPCLEKQEIVLFTALSSYKDTIKRYTEDKCDPLVSEKLEVMCFTPSKKMTSCDKTMEKNSRATFRCKRPIYWEIKEPEYTEITCKNGQWDHPLVDDFCERDCGRYISKWERPTFGTKNKIENIEFPWHALIYEFDPLTGGYDQRCAGTLISTNIVISAADCYVKKNSREPKIPLKDFSTFKVALGKFYSNINNTEDDFAQIRDIIHVEIPPEYQHKQSNYIGNIAVVVLNEKVEYSWAVQPICIDVGEDNFEREQLVEGALGKFAGLRIYRGHEPSRTLQLVETPFIPTRECKTKITRKYHHLVGEDIFCVGREDTKSHFCDNDSGGGLVFFEPNKKKYYLRGLASLSPPCSEKNLGLFTKLSLYKWLIERYHNPALFLGIKPNRPTRMGNQDCVELNGIGCLATNCCSNLACVEGPDGNWEQGQCVERYPPDFPPTSPEIHEQDKYYFKDYCEPLVSEKLTITCFTPFNKVTSCAKNLTISSSATFHCKRPIYLEERKPEYTQITCKNGKWDRPLIDDFCEVGCGRSITNVPVPAIINGKTSEFGEFPWHAGIYELNTTGGYIQQCGGTLISPKVVISAAHCVAIYLIKQREVQIKDLSKLKVALGKYYRDFNSSEDALAQIKDIAKIGVSNNYHGSLWSWAGDIAFIVLKEKVEYSQIVLPICVDVGEDSFEKDQLVKRAVGLVAGWGITNLERGPSEKLKFAELPFVPMEECEKKVGETWLPYLNTRDKLCVGMESADMNICGGDSGGGLVFKEPASRRYYLRGIVSLGPKCDLQDGFALFTDLSTYKNLVQKYLQEQ